VSQAGVVTRLAIRELWITFRLVAMLVGFVGVGSAVALLPAPLAATVQRLAVGIGAGSVVVAAVAAWSLADERIRGRAGWLVTRSVPRGTLVAGWFVAIGSVSVAGLAAAAALGWLAASGVSLRLDPGSYAVLLFGAAATLLAAVALGILLGALLPPRPAALATALLAVAIGAAAWGLPQADGLLPGAALVQLASLTEAPIAIAAAWRAAGAALVATALLLVLARLALGRAEL
jgi:hypothetical protein